MLIFSGTKSKSTLSLVIPAAMRFGVPGTLVRANPNHLVSVV